MLMFLAGCVASCGALLVLAGASKLYRGARRMDGTTAIWRALRIPRRLTRRAELAAGGLEGVTGALVCARVYPVAGGVAMAALGAAFCALLIYVRVNRIPGSCGCVSWRRRADSAAKTVTWRAVARAGMLTAAGIADALASNGGTAALHRLSFYAGVLTGGIALSLLSAHGSVRTPVCHRPLWRPARTSMRALTGHEVFAAMVSAVGPLGSDVRHHRTGCTDEFWFPVMGGDDGEAVVFRVNHAVPGGSPAVHATVRTHPNHCASLAVISPGAANGRRRSHEIP
jgi:hypothetical protein